MAALPQEFIPSTIDPANCPRIKSDGKQCGNRAGKATEHLGHGYCYKHGGNTRNGARHGAKLAAVAEMRESSGEVDVNPLDAMLYTVRRASHLAAYYRLQREAVELDGGDASILAGLEREALGDLNQWADRAIKAGVAERMVRIAENTGAVLQAAFEAGVAAMVAAGLEVSADHRRAAVAAFAADLSRLEREQPAIAAKATDA